MNDLHVGKYSSESSACCQPALLPGFSSTSKRHSASTRKWNGCSVRDIGGPIEDKTSSSYVSSASVCCEKHVESSNVRVLLAVRARVASSSLGET